MATKKQAQRNFAVSKEVEEKLLKLRNYHNKTYNSLFAILVENAFLSMEEAINLNKGKELEEQTLKVGFQVQQLTLMFSELKKELAEVRRENINLKENIEEIKEDKKEISKALNDEILKNKGRSEKVAAQLEKQSSKITSLEKYNQEKDKTWLDKIRG